ncbi:MAG: MraY family glycosyltransferase, partial [Desulfosudaceae bacterium]
YNGIFNPAVCSILYATLLIFMVGLLDDIHEVSAKLKLMAQVTAVIVVVQQGVVLRVVPLQLGMTAQVANLALTFLWIIGITNAMNFFDGMNGLAAGLGAMIAFFLGLVAFQTDQAFIGWISIAIMGSCLGFLPYNLRGKGKASVFLGDAGSTVIGFVLACIAVYSDWSSHDPLVSLASPLLIFWVIIFDMIHITIDRVLTGKVASIKQWLEYVGHDHLHHRLAQVVGSHRKSVLFIFLLNGSLGISAVILRHLDSLEAALLMLQAVLLVLFITVLERHSRFPATQQNPDDGPRPDADD